MDLKEEKLAQNIRDCGHQVKLAERALAKAEANEKRLMATLMLGFQTNEGIKSTAAQTTNADATDEMYRVRVKRGVAKGMLASAKSNLTAAEAEVRIWQTKIASINLEKRAYRA